MLTAGILTLASFLFSSLSLCYMREQKVEGVEGEASFYWRK
jgi:hypothetical protein